VHGVRIVGGAATDSLLLAFRAAENSIGDDSVNVPGTRVVLQRSSSVQAAVSVS